MPDAAQRGRPYFAVACLVPLAFTIARADELVAPYVPTVEEDVELMMDVAGVRPDDYVIDLGSGDGRIVISAARRGAAGHGVELDPELVELAGSNALDAGVADRVTFLEGDIFDADIRAATVVSLYLFPDANILLRPKLLAELRPGTRVVSNSFHMEEWAPDVHDMSARSSGGILLWIIPARIEGNWDLEIDGGPRYSVAIDQTYQEVQLALAGSGPILDTRDATLEGDRIRFGADSADTGYLFDGTVNGDRIEGYVHIGRGNSRTVTGWRATRVTTPGGTPSPTRRLP